MFVLSFTRGSKLDSSIRTLIVDLHGMRRSEAVEKTLDAINQGIQEDYDKVLVIHGKSGGKLKVAVHMALKQIFAVKKIVFHQESGGATTVFL